MKTILFVLLLAGLLCGAVSCFAETAEPAMEIPAEYKTAVPDGGTVTRIEYPSRDYTKDSAEITKPAALYLPPDYSETEHYDVLVLCHGIGGTEREWGFLNKDSVGKNIVDHLILNGEIRPVIIVMPNGRSTADCGNTDWSNMQAFYSFGQEIRNDLLPYIDANYATYGSLTPDDLSAARDHRWMAGLSMGGMQTINIGMCECMDLFSAFGAFSAAPTSYTASRIASEIDKNFEGFSIRMFYSVCGLQDSTAYASASAAAKDLPAHSGRFTDENWIWQERSGSHDWPIWYLGLYNFLRIVGQ